MGRECNIEILNDRIGVSEFFSFHKYCGLITTGQIAKFYKKGYKNVNYSKSAK